MKKSLYLKVLSRYRHLILSNKLRALIVFKNKKRKQVKEFILRKKSYLRESSNMWTLFLKKQIEVTMSVDIKSYFYDNNVDFISISFLIIHWILPWNCLTRTIESFLECLLLIFSAFLKGDLHLRALIFEQWTIKRHSYW